MFATQTLFDPLLFPPRHRQQSLLPPHALPLQSAVRLVVNHLRSGHLITPSLVNHLRVVMADAGWRGGRPGLGTTQEDTGECLLWLMDMLKMPAVPMNIRFFHGADASLPSSHQHGHDANGMASSSSSTEPMRSAGESMVVTERVLSISVTPELNQHASRHTWNVFGQRTPQSITSDIMLEELLEAHFFATSIRGLRRSVQHPTRPGERKDVLVDALAIMELMPFWTMDASDAPNVVSATNQTVSEKSQQRNDPALFQDKKVALPIILKRYGVDHRGNAYKIQRRIIVPEEIDFSRFVINTAHRQDSAQSSEGPPLYSTLPEPVSMPGFALHLRSAICHRGDSLHSGHYIAYVQTKVAAATSNGSAMTTRSAWLKFDD